MIINKKIVLLPVKLRTTLLFMILTFAGIPAFAQSAIKNQDLETKLFKPYKSYFRKDGEWVYTHLNKSSYIKGDDIWFTSYVLNPVNQGLNFNTTKLYVELWSPEKKLVSRQILPVFAGSTNNFIHLADSLPPGSYCFRAYTSWMRNFYQDNDLATVITVLGNDKVFGKEPTEKHVDESAGLNTRTVKDPVSGNGPDYDIQFLPESGTFLEGVDNVLGVRATDPYGMGVKITGKVFSADNQEIASFATSSFGTDNITIPGVSNQNYRVAITLPDGTTRDLHLPKSESKGVIIHIDPFRPDVVHFKIQTNNTALPLNNSFVVMIHANGVLYKSYRVHFAEEKVIKFTISKKELGTGIIYLTLFDQNLTPVSERLFCNLDSSVKGSVDLTAVQLTGDTVNLKVVIPDSLNIPQFAKLSASVLPGETVLNHFNNSLMAESVLRPALRGNLVNPTTYFEKIDFDHTVAIDNLLLTQGWRKYDWPVVLKDTLPKFAYPFEEGFSIEGSIRNWFRNKPDLNSKITIISPMNNIFLLSPVDGSGIFKLDHVYLADSTWILASASAKSGKGWNRLLQLSIPESFMDAPKFRQLITPPARKEIVEDIPKMTQGDILLDEVVVTAQKKSPFANNVYVGMMSNTLEITKENYRQYNSVEMILAKKFNVMTERSQDGEYHFNMGRGSSSQLVSEPLMMIDEMRVTNPGDIINFPVDLVEAIAVDKDGFVGAGGTIAIKTRTTRLFEYNVEPINFKRLLIHGYVPPRKYFEPKYIIPPGSTSYEKYATIFWKPDLVTDSINSAAFRFHVPNEIKSIMVRMEGISPGGKTFLYEQKIALPGRN